MLLYSLVCESLSEHELEVVHVIQRNWIPDNANFIRYKVSVPVLFLSLKHHVWVKWLFCTLKLDTFLYNVTHHEGLNWANRTFNPIVDGLFAGTWLVEGGR